MRTNDVAWLNYVHLPFGTGFVLCLNLDPLFTGELTEDWVGWRVIRFGPSFELLEADGRDLLVRPIRLSEVYHAQANAIRTISVHLVGSSVATLPHIFNEHILVVRVTL